MARCPWTSRSRGCSRRLALPALTLASEGLARIGDLLGVLALSLPWGVWLVWRRRLDAFWHITAGLLGIAALNTLGKALFARPRPDIPAHLADSFSYPSAHASSAVVLFGLAAAFAARELTPTWRHWAYWAAILAATLMALSRLVIGVHWFSDLVGGALLGLVVCALVQLAWQARPRPRLAPCPWPWLTAASLGLVAARIAWLPPVQPRANHRPTPIIRVPAMRVEQTHASASRQQAAQPAAAGGVEQQAAELDGQDQRHQHDELAGQRPFGIEEGGSSATKKAHPLGLATAVTKPWVASCTRPAGATSSPSSGIAMRPRERHIMMPR